MSLLKSVSVSEIVQFPNIPNQSTVAAAAAFQYRGIAFTNRRNALANKKPTLSKATAKQRAPHVPELQLSGQSTQVQTTKVVQSLLAQIQQDKEQVLQLQRSAPGAAELSPSKQKVPQDIMRAIRASLNAKEVIRQVRSDGA